MDASAQMTDLALIRKFVLAGHATFTLVSRRSGERRTFRVEQAPKTERHPKPGYFVRFLHGPDNTNDYRYLGFMFANANGGLQIKVKGEGTSPTARAFEWMLAMLTTHIVASAQANARFVEQAEFWHAGECGRCGRLLTDPESIRIGLGPICTTM